MLYASLANDVQFLHLALGWFEFAFVSFAAGYQI